MLEEFYKGDKLWEDFVSVFPKHDSLQCKEEYKQLFNNMNMNKGLSVVIYELIGSKESLNWVTQDNPALGGLKPIECLEGNLLNRLRTMLMRF